VLYYLRDHRLNAQMSTIGAGPLADICAGFQASVVDVLVTKTMRAARAMKVRDMCLAGGVSANSELRRRLGEEARAGGFRLFYPSLEYCMDNGAMIAYVGWLRLRQGVESGMELAAVPNLELA
jgi:N6-L-threonylcarbamoyladenine synthase